MGVATLVLFTVTFSASHLAKLDWLFNYSAQRGPAREYRPHPEDVYTRVITLPAPDTFQLGALATELTAKDEPTPVRTQSVPLRPFNDPKVFTDVDKHALQVIYIKYHNVRIKTYIVHIEDCGVGEEED